MIAVAINVYKETTLQLLECFRRISVNLPKARAKVFLDGVDRPEVVRLATFFEFDSVVVPHCGCSDRWFLWWLRMMEFFRGSGADVCFKLDPDTMVDRLPVLSEADYFGTIESFNGYDYVQGGITGMSQHAVKLAKTVLEQRTFKNLSECIGLHEGCFSGPVEEWPFADDHAIAHVFKQVGILPVSWAECRSVWKTPVDNADLKFAIVHPRHY